LKLNLKTLQGHVSNQFSRIKVDRNIKKSCGIKGIKKTKVLYFASPVNFYHSYQPQLQTVVPYMLAYSTIYYRENVKEKHTRCFEAIYIIDS